MEIIHARPSRLVISNALILAFPRPWCAGRIYARRSSFSRSIYHSSRVDRRSSVWIRRKLRLLLLKGSPRSRKIIFLSPTSPLFFFSFSFSFSVELRGPGRREGERGISLARISHPFWHGELVVGRAGQRSIMYAREPPRRLSSPSLPALCPRALVRHTREKNTNKIIFIRSRDKVGGNSERRTENGNTWIRFVPRDLNVSVASIDRSISKSRNR